VRKYHSLDYSTHKQPVLDAYVGVRVRVRVREPPPTAPPPPVTWECKQAGISTTMIATLLTCSIWKGMGLKCWDSGWVM